MQKKLSVNVAFVLLLLTICISSTTCVLEDDIRQLLEQFRLRMCHPIPKFGLPALDPLQISHKEYETNNRILVDFESSITDFNLTGLSDFDITELKIATLPLKKSIVNITLPLTAINSNYTAKGSLGYIVNLAGDGNAEAYVKSLSVAVSWKLKYGKYLKISDFKLDIKIGEIYLSLENFLENERLDKFFHDLINELGLELMGDVWSAENEKIENALQNKINNFGNYTLVDIAKIIAGAGEGGPIFGPNDPPPDCKENEIPQLPLEF